MKALPENSNFFTAATYYNRWLYNGMISPYLFLGFLVGVISLLFFDKRTKELAFLILWILVPYFLLILCPYKSSRYILPALPAFAILTMGGVYRMPNKLFRAMCYASIFSIAFIQFFHFSFGPIPISQSSSYRYYMRSPPSRNNWKIKETVDFLSGYAKSRNKSVCLVIEKHQYFRFSSFYYYVSYHGLPFDVKKLDQLVEAQDVTKTKLERSKLQNCDFVVTMKQDGKCVYADELCKRFDIIIDEPEFTEIKEFNLPDNYKAIIYENTRKNYKH